jgi:hypothetical protein
MTITEQLGAAIADAKIRTGKLPRVCRISEQSLRNIMLGHQPTAATADKIAAALGMKWKMVSIKDDQQ